MTDKDQKPLPQLVTLSYQASEILHMTAHIGVFAAACFLIGTPYGIGFTAFGIIYDWCWIKNSGKKFSRLVIEDPRLHRDYSSSAYHALKDMVVKLTPQTEIQKTIHVVVHYDAGYQNICAGGDPPFVAAYAPLLKLLRPKELFAIAGHELTHLAADHAKWRKTSLVLSNLAGNIATWNLGASLFSHFHLTHVMTAGLIYGATILANGIVSMSRAHMEEKEADRGAVLLTGEPQALASVLGKLLSEKLEEVRNKKGNSFLKSANIYLSELSCQNRQATILRNLQHQCTP